MVPPALSAVLGILGSILGLSTAAPSTPPYAPYADPPFAAQCQWHSFGEGEAPPLALAGQDPLCVEYSKRDITVSNGGVVAFLLAEPMRFAIAIPACRYWQRDHWQVRLAPGQTPLVGWDGSYWWDESRGRAGVHFSGFTVLGRPAGVDDAARAVRPFSAALADELTRYGGGPGDSGVSVSFPAIPCAS
jgi:hypothetical protein